MAINPFTQFIFDLFIISAIIIIAYTCNFYYLAFLSRKRKDVLPTIDLGTPSITIQLPIYNEKYVAKRLVDAVCNLDYPKEKMRIMVLDDSDDETVELVRNVVNDYKEQGFLIEHVRRGTRNGYKAGALKHAMQTTDSEFVAIFDADFIPPTWFLKRAIPHFSKSNIGLIQCRWGHVNENYSTITQAQALALDFHFLIEQKAKSNSHLFMNFNGTAGIWKRECIEDAGGWHTATLVEDLDLSYRAQMKGGKCVFLPDIVVDAELPAQMNASTAEFHKKSEKLFEEMQTVKNVTSKASSDSSKEMMVLLKLSEYQSGIRMNAESKYGDVKDLEKMASQTANIVNLFDRISIELGEKIPLPYEVRQWAISKIFDCADKWEIRFSDVYSILTNAIGRDMFKEAVRIQQVRDIYGIRAVDEIRNDLNIS